MDEIVKEKVEQWRIKAEHDLKIVERTIALPDPLTDVLSFHCQQAAEKYLKLYLVSKGIELKKTHDIGFLIGECMKVNPVFKEILDSAFLSLYAVETRYPDDFYMPPLQELQRAFEAAVRVKTCVVSAMTERQ